MSSDDLNSALLGISEGVRDILVPYYTGKISLKQKEDLLSKKYELETQSKKDILMEKEKLFNSLSENNDRLSFNERVNLIKLKQEGEQNLFNLRKEKELSPEEKAEQITIGKKKGELRADKSHIKQKVIGGISEISDTIRLVDDLLTKPLWKGTGLYSPIASFFSGSEGADIKAKIDTLKSKIGLATFSNMKELSKTGTAGFGSLSESEMDLMQQSLAPLKENQSPTQLLESLKEIKRVFERSKKRLEDSYFEKYNENLPEEESGLESSAEEADIVLTGKDAKRLTELRKMRVNQK